MRALLLLAALFAPVALSAQTGGSGRIIPVEETIRAGIDRDSLDALYIDGDGAGCTTCRFDEKQRDVYEESWNAFLGELMNGLIEKDVAFSELVLRAYFSADGHLDYLLYHVGGGDANEARFEAAAEQLRQRFRFALAAQGPFKQCATIALGPPMTE